MTEQESFGKNTDIGCSPTFDPVCLQFNVSFNVAEIIFELKAKNLYDNWFAKLIQLYK